MNLYNEVQQKILDKSKQGGLDLASINKILENLSTTKVNILMIGGTGVGKSSTVNALLEMDTAKIGQGSNPETQEIQKYELDNIVIWDSPGLGDSSEKDKKYVEMLTKKMQETDTNGNALIDLVFLILDSTSRDYKSAYELIRDVIEPNLGRESESRLLIGLNKIDAIHTGILWDNAGNCPTEELEKVLEEKVASVQQRILEESGLNVEPIYYSAGLSYGSIKRNPYNMAKLLDTIMGKLPNKKRLVVLNDINRNAEHFVSDDGKRDYIEEIREKAEKGFFQSFMDEAAALAKGVGGKVSEVLKESIESEEFKAALKSVAIEGGKFIYQVLLNLKKPK